MIQSPLDRLSRQFHDDDLAGDARARNRRGLFDVIIVGSGYGGAVAASRLARARNENGKPVKVALLERGREFQLGEYPTSLTDLPNRVWIDAPEGTAGIEADALFDIRINEGVSILSGRGLGGTSQINANVAARPDPRVFQHKAWPTAIRDQAESLAPYFSLAEDMLQAHPYPVNRTEPNKLKALRQFQEHLVQNGCKEAQFVKPPLTINFEQNYKHPITGVVQDKCTDCGNCIAGCNEGAKSTLAVNYLMDAALSGKLNEENSHENNIDIFELCTATHVERGERQRWRVHVRDTAHPTRSGYFEAEVVILAAGVIGTTEVLLRSREKANKAGKFFATSNLLGARLSANADMIGFGYGHQLTGAEEEGLNTVNWGEPEGKPGPTITGMIDLRKHRSIEDGLVIQEGGTPSAFAWIFEEVMGLTTSLRRAAQAEKRLRIKEDKDKLLPSRTGLSSTQVYLAMGHDKITARDFTEGHVELIDDRPRIKWASPGRHPVYGKQHELLSECPKSLGGIYIPNPAWQLLPEKLAKVIDLSETIVGNQVVTVHPLGGCCMGDDATTGVVDHQGRVYSNTTGTSVFDGLLVCDGSIIPTSLGINPLLTITALAERAIALLAEEKKWQIDYTRKQATPHVRNPGRLTKPTPAMDGVALEFAETLKGDGYAPPGSNIRVRPLFRRWASSRIVRFGVDATLTVRHDSPNSKASDQAFRASSVSGRVTLSRLTREAIEKLFPTDYLRARLGEQTRARLFQGGGRHSKSQPRSPTSSLSSGT